MRMMQVLFKAKLADRAEALEAANAVAILRQQIREAAAALAAAKRELALAMGHHAGEARAVAALNDRIAALEDSGRKAIAQGREDLAWQASTAIATLRQERSERQAATGEFSANILRMKAQVDHGCERLRALDRGFHSACAAEAVRRVGITGRGTSAFVGGALGDAERTLARLRDRQSSEEAVHRALATIDADTPAIIEAELDREGFGPRQVTDARTVFEQLRAAPPVAS